MKPTAFSCSDYARLQIDMERKNEYVNALIAENERLRKQLDAYEDIGTVEDFQRLVTAQNEGRLVELPCKVGNDIYWINDEENSVSVQKNGIRGILVRKDGFAIEDTDGFIDIAGTKYCYLTREEAAEALAKEGKA